MKKIFSILFILLISTYSLFAQTWTKEYAKPENEQITPDWGADILVSNTEPFGKLTGAAKTNGTIYLAVPDTAIESGKSIVIFRSTNNGTTWTNFLSYAGTVMPSRAKMVRTGLDSIYYFYLINSIIYCLNVENIHLGSITTTTYRDFDAVGSSTGGLYVIADALTSTSIPRYSSIDGFSTISQTGSVSTGSFPRMYMSGSGDTLILTFYSPAADTLAGVIRAARYRETTPGQISSAGFQDVCTETVVKSEVQPVFFRGVVWIIYTLGTTGAIDIKCRLSTNSGANYAAPINLAANPNTDEYYFEARHFITGSGGLDIAYYSDSLQGGAATNNTDKMLYKYDNLSTPGTFSSPVQISQHPPVWSARGYLPAMVEIYNTSDVGFAWVGLVVGTSNKRVWWDRFNLVSGISGNENEVPQKYSLKQNYPNPFNPATKIDFSIPKNGNVTLKIYDIVGKEIETLINKDLSAGSYTFNFNASRLPSGLYFYKLTSGTFSETKKMILVK